MAFRQQAALFLLALGFLTRIGAARPAAPADLAAAARFFPAVGLLLGCLVVTPVWLGLGRGQPWIQAYLSVFLNAWLTRGLHLDGLADLADAWGCMGSREDFWRVLKDSRIGTFGCLAIVVAVGGELVFAHALLASGKTFDVALAPFWSRCAALLFMALTHAAPRSSLGRLFSEKTRAATAIVWLALCFLLQWAFSSFAAALFSLLAILLLLFFLHRAARQAGGMNGDFIGALVTLSETAVLAVLALQEP